MSQSDEYYIDPETGLLVFTMAYLLRRGYCCGKTCRYCPYLPKYEGGNVVDPQHFEKK